jgi:hypothetical protein
METILVSTDPHSTGVKIPVRFRPKEFELLKRICDSRECTPEELLRELALCELAEYRARSGAERPRFNLRPLNVASGGR